MFDRKRQRILIVDDDSLLSSAVFVQLEASGYDVRQATDGEAGLQALERDPVDLVLLDLVMPRRSGLRVLERLGARASTQPRVMVISSRHDRSTVLRALSLGADDFLQKPLILSILLRRVDTLLAGARFLNGSSRKRIRTEDADQMTLEQLLARRGAIDVREALEIARHLARRLFEHHKQGGVHGAVEPANVRLGRLRGRGYIATLQEPGARAMKQVASRRRRSAYDAPEWRAGQAEPDPRSDIYSLGVVLLEMLTGQKPYRDEVTGRTVLGRLDGPSPPLGELLSSHDGADTLDTMIRRMVAERHTARFTTMFDVIDVTNDLITLAALRTGRF